MHILVFCILQLILMYHHNPNVLKFNLHPKQDALWIIMAILRALIRIKVASPSLLLADRFIRKVSEKSEKFNFSKIMTRKIAKKIGYVLI